MSNLKSGISKLGRRQALGWCQLNVDAVRGPVDFDEDGGGEAEQGLAVREAANFAGAAFDLLLDGPLDGVGVRGRRQCGSGKVKTARPSGTLCSRQSARRSARRRYQRSSPARSQRAGVPDPAQLGADPLADGGVGGVVNGVLREVELAALPDGTGQDGAAGGLQPGMVVTDDEADAADAAVDQAVEEGSPVDFGFRWIAGDAEHAPSPVRSDADGGEQGGIADHAAVTQLLVAGIEQEIVDLAQRPADALL